MCSKSISLQVLVLWGLMSCSGSHKFLRTKDCWQNTKCEIILQGESTTICAHTVVPRVIKLVSTKYTWTRRHLFQHAQIPYYFVFPLKIVLLYSTALQNPCLFLNLVHVNWCFCKLLELMWSVLTLHILMLGKYQPLTTHQCTHGSKEV